MNSIEPPLLSLLGLDWTADGSCGKHREFLVGWANRVLTNLECWFADRDFVATKDFTVADILMVHVLSGIKYEALIAPYPGIASYRDRCLARPAWKRTFIHRRQQVAALRIDRETRDRALVSQFLGMQLVAIAPSLS